MRLLCSVVSLILRNLKKKKKKSKPTFLSSQRPDEYSQEKKKIKVVPLHPTRHCFRGAHASVRTCGNNYFKAEMHVLQEAGTSLLVLSHRNTLGLAFVLLFRAPCLTIASPYCGHPACSPILHLHSEKGMTLTVPVIWTISEVSCPYYSPPSKPSATPLIAKVHTHPPPFCCLTSNPSTEALCTGRLKGLPLFNCLSHLASFFSCARC